MRATEFITEDIEQSTYEKLSAEYPNMKTLLYFVPGVGQALALADAASAVDIYNKTITDIEKKYPVATIQQVQKKNDEFDDGWGYIEDTFTLDESGKATRKLCKSTKPNSELGASQLSSCISQGFRARATEKKFTINRKRQKVKGKKVKGGNYGGPLPVWKGNQ